MVGVRPLKSSRKNVPMSNRSIAHSVLLAGAAVAVFGVTAAPQPAEAHRACRPAVEASATGLGVLGRGERRANIKARSNWEEKVRALYGDRFARLSTARGIVTSCKGGTLAPAKCTVIARPCRV